MILPGKKGAFRMIQHWFTRKSATKQRSYLPRAGGFATDSRLPVLVVNSTDRCNTLAALPEVDTKYCLSDTPCHPADRCRSSLPKSRFSLLHGSVALAKLTIPEFPVSIPERQPAFICTIDGVTHYAYNLFPWKIG